MCEKADYTLEYDRLTRRWHWEFFDDGAMAQCGSSASRDEAMEAVRVARMEYFDEVFTGEKGGA